MGSPWKAVADDSRRQMLVLLRDGDKTPTEIAEHFQFSRPALSTHLRILNDAGLVKERKEGRNRIYSVNRDAMREMIEFFDAFWESQPSDLKKHVEGKKIREDTGFEQGTVVEVEKEGERAVIKPIRKKKRAWKQLYGIRPRRTGKPEWPTPDEIKSI